MSIDLSAAASVTLEQAIAQSNHHFVWRARMIDGTVICEQPGLSSDNLPRDDVVAMEYRPTRTKEFPTILCEVDLNKGERFVRYWTTIWHQGQGQARVYVLGIENGGKFALVAVYPHFGCKLVFGATKPFCPPWIPKPFHCLPPEVIIQGGPGTSSVGWVHDGFGGAMVRFPNKLVFRALYPD